MINFADNIEICNLQLFDAAFPVKPGNEGEVMRRFMTLFVHESRRQRGGSAEVCLATNAQGERFALKRMRVEHPDNEELPPLDTPARKELRNSLGSSSSGTGGSTTSGTPDYVTQGHVAAFYEEYRIHLAVSRLRGFPGLFGFGLSSGNPVIVMEWVEGVTLRQALRERAVQDVAGLSPANAIAGGQADKSVATRAAGNADKSAGKAGLLPLDVVASLGIGTLELLERAGELSDTFVHRDISPRNIMLREDRTPAADQLASGAFDLCLIDFGSAALNADATASDPTFTAQSNIWRMGTPAYAPPEMLTSDVALPDGYRQSPAIDVYALSSVLFELYAGSRPFKLSGRGDLSPYRLKTETSPAELVPREPDGGALAGIIMTGLSAQQGDRPTTSELKAALENWRRLPSQRSIGALHGAKTTDASFWQPGAARRTLTRRALVSGAIVAVAAVASAGLVATKVLASAEPALDESRYARAAGPYEGKPLFKAYDGQMLGWALYTSAGDVACKPTSSRELGQLREGLASLYDDASGRYGYIAPTGDTDGYAWAVLPAFSQASDFSESLAAVQDPATKLWGYVDVDGTWAIEPTFGAASSFSCGVAATQDTSSLLWGAVDKSGAWAIEPTLGMLGSRDEDGHAVAQSADDPASWGIVDASGAWATDARFCRLRRMSCGLAPAFDDSRGLWGYVDAASAWQIEPTFMDARPFAADADSNDALAAVQDKDTQLWYFVGTDGAPAHDMKPRFLKLGDLHDGLAPAQASAADGKVEFDEDDPDSYVQGAGMRYGYVDATGAWQMRRLVTLTDAAIPAPEL